MKRLLAVPLLLLIWTFSLPAVTVTLGVDSRAVGIVSGGSRVVNVDRVDVFAVDQQILIAGVTGLKLVMAVGSDSIIINSPADATVVNAQIRVVIDNLDHSSVRVLWTTDSSTYASVSFGLSSGSYPYRTYENGVAQTINKLSLGGLAPGTTYYLRVNAKPNIGADATGICNTDPCGSKEIVITTPPEAVRHPELPQAPATFDTRPPDTSGYRVFPVPAFPDGAKTGSIPTGTATLVVNNSDGMLPNHWIFIDGAACSLLFTPVTMPQVGACKIGSVAGNTVTLTSNVTGTVNDAAISWALFTVQDFMEPKNPYYVGYGTVFEWAQGYKGRWYAIQDASYGQFGLKLPGMAPDDNPNCSSHPCSLTDPAHRWIVLRTAAGPGLLPSPGVRTGPAWGPVLGAIVAQNPNVGSNNGEVLWAGDGSYTQLPHHVRIENLELTHSADPSLADATDPRPFTGLVTIDGRSATIIPQSIILDRVYVHGQGAPARVRFGVDIGGKYNALIDSYVGQIDYWRPYAPLVGPCSVSGNVLTIPGQTYQRKKVEPGFRMQGAVTATLGSSGGYTGNFIAFLKPDGAIGINYSSPKVGSASISCSPNCLVAANDDVIADVLAPNSLPANSVKFCSGAIASNAFALSVPLYSDSVYNTEGSIGVSISDGAGPYVIRNNSIEGYGIGFFVDSSGLFAPIPSDVTFQRNYLFWNQDHRITSAATNGYVYTVRNLWEIKRGKRWSLDGNIFEGQWARINQGASILLSGRTMTSPSVPPAGDGISDISITNNTVRNGSTAFYCQGGSASTGGDPPLTKRILYSNNLNYGMDAFTYQDTPLTPFIGDTFRILLGCQDISIRHNTAYYSVGPYPWQLTLGTLIFGEGLDVSDNIFHLNTSNGAAGISADVNQNTDYPQNPVMTAGDNYKDTLDSTSVRIGAAIQPSYTFANNIIIGGTSGNTLSSQVDLTPSEMTKVFMPKYGTLAARQFFPTGATRAQREAAVGWISAVGSDFRLAGGSQFASKGSDGADIGADMNKVEAAQGATGTLRILDVSDTSATVALTAPDPGRSCWVANGEPGAPVYTYTLSNRDDTGEQVRMIPVRGLTADHRYVVVAFCDGAPVQPIGSFQTRP